MKKILIIGNPNSPLVRARGVIGQQAGYEVHWYSGQRTEGLPCVEYHSMPAWIYNRFVLRAILEPFVVAYYLWVIQPDLVHVHYASKGLVAIPLSFSRRLIVSTMGSDIMPGVGYKGIYKFFTRLLLNAADKITTKSDFMDRAVLRIGNYSDKLERVTWGIDLKQFRSDRDLKQIRKKLVIPDNSIVLFDPRSAHALYNKDVILRAFAKSISKLSRPAVLLSAFFSEDKKYLKVLEELIDKLDIANHVTLLGKLSHEEMADYYNLADITLSVPSSDGLPQTIYEALACGSFLIVGNLLQYEGVVEDFVTARIVPVRDTEALAEAIGWVAAHENERLAAMKIGRSYVEQHADIKKQTDRVIKMYEKLLTT